MIVAIGWILWLAWGYLTMYWNSYFEEEPFVSVTKEERRVPVSFYYDGNGRQIVHNYETIPREIRTTPTILVLAGGGFGLLWMLAKYVSVAGTQRREEAVARDQQLTKDLADANAEIDRMMRHEIPPEPALEGKVLLVPNPALTELGAPHDPRLDRMNDRRPR